MWENKVGQKVKKGCQREYKVGQWENKVGQRVKKGCQSVYKVGQWENKVGQKVKKKVVSGYIKLVRGNINLVSRWIKFELIRLCPGWSGLIIVLKGL